jgi:hypothetical protein
MTDLLNRPASSTTPSSARGAASGRPLTVTAALGSLGAAATGLVACMAVSVIGWFLADAGAHGDTTDALRIGADVWLVGHGSHVSLGGVPLGITPLALTAFLALVLYRFGRWASATSAPVDTDRVLGTGATVFTGVYVVVAVVTCLAVTTSGVAPGLGRTILASLLLAGVAGSVGMAVGAGRLGGLVGRVPGWVRAIGHGAVASALLVVAAASLLVATMVVLGLNQASEMLTHLQLSTGDVITYLVVCLLLVPNAVLLGAAYLLGPGFAVGTGTVVSPSAVVVGQVPAFPLLAALPSAGPVPSWAMGVLAVPVLAAVVGAAMAQRSYRVTAWDSAALRGFGSGLVGAVLVTALVALAGGPMGTGRMADIGAPLGEVLVAALTAMCAGGLVGGLVTAWLQRRREAHD